MAERPVFVPILEGPRLVQEVVIDFVWHPGMTPSQKKKNIAALHERAAARGLKPLLEVSSKSEREVGQKLSAFNLRMLVEGEWTTVESVYQGSKIFEKGGPFCDLIWKDSREAKKDSRLQESGNLVGFSFQGESYPLTPTTAFYDWIYICALFPHREWLKRLQQCAGFTDIEFNPMRSLNCQARSCAVFVALLSRNLLEQAVSDFSYFRSVLQRGTI